MSATHAHPRHHVTVCENGGASVFDVHTSWFVYLSINNKSITVNKYTIAPSISDVTDVLHERILVAVNNSGQSPLGQQTHTGRN